MSPIDQAAMHLDVVSLEEVRDNKGYVKDLAKEFFAASGSINGAGKIRVLERWLTQLGVGWVLRVADEAGLGQSPPDAARLWSWALSEMNRFIKLVFHDTSCASLSIIWEEESAVMESKTQQVGSITEQVEFARFIQEAMVRMTSFIDFIIAAVNPICGLPGLYEKLDALLHVHDAVSNAVADLSCYALAGSTEFDRILSEMVSLLLQKEGETGEAIWRIMEEFWTRILQYVEGDNVFWRHPQGSSSIHYVILSLTSYIRLLYAHHRLVDQIVSEAASLGNYVTRIANNDPFATLTMEMTLLIQEKLAQKSLLFPTQSFRFLFLVNNSYFIWKELHELRVFKSNPLCKFESEFMRTYTTQKLWKVPDPTLRARLRNAIVERVAADYRKYLEVNSVSTPRITPQELEEMLQDLFEG
ncbi:hypothetical protein EJB05_46174, partial [Eragrostis curvula]